MAVAPGMWAYAEQVPVWLGAMMDASRDDVLAYMDFPQRGLGTDQLNQSPRVRQQGDQAPFRRGWDLPELRRHHQTDRRADGRNQRRVDCRAPLHGAGVTGPHHRYSQHQAARRGLLSSSSLSEGRP